MVGLQQKDLFRVIRVAHLLLLVMPVVGLLQEVTMNRIQAVAGVVVQELREQLDQELVQRLMVPLEVMAVWVMHPTLPALRSLMPRVQLARDITVWAAVERVLE
jgi:hypothetical protein